MASPEPSLESGRAAAPQTGTGVPAGWLPQQRRSGPEADHVRILVVDDEGDMRLLVTMTLTVEGGFAVVAEASDGREAVAAWREHRPDVVVMDLRMPGLTGIEAAEIILRDEPAQRIVLFSASIDAGTWTRAGKVGVAACLEKTKIDQLADVLRDLHLGALQGEPG